MEEETKRRIEELFEIERDRLEGKLKLSDEDDEKLLFFVRCNEQAVHLSEVLDYTATDLIELGFNKKGARDRLLAWIYSMRGIYVARQ